jgi:mRNA interferase RelE/StbE
MSWGYDFLAAASRDLRNIGPSAAKDIKDFFEKRVKGCPDPRAFGKPMRGDKFGFWRYRVKDYRIICAIQDDRLVVVAVHIAHRSTVYGE